MNEVNKKYLWKLIQLTGDSLINKLPDHPNHPNGRNPYAHVALKVKNKFGKSYKYLPDEKVNEVINYLNILKQTEGNSKTYINHIKFLINFYS
ncbi:MAG: hypothetical protein CM15mP114_12540 [Alphaproteobacteria bacterium]|nr:MAG: hypothetical protein CM15mP114_12540 [Alphaproteobacteria bacterium]